MDTTKKFEPRIDTLATAYHQRITQLQGTLNQIKDLVKKAGDEGNTIASSLDAVCGQFNKLDPSVTQLEDTIQKVGEASHIAAKLDGIFKPLQWMLQQYTCVGDQNNIKANALKSFQLISNLTSEPPIVSNCYI